MPAGLAELLHRDTSRAFTVEPLGADLSVGHAARAARGPEVDPELLGERPAHGGLTRVD
jgi:hypothetical protein